jgi:hypothetical protein
MLRPTAPCLLLALLPTMATAAPSAGQSKATLSRPVAGHAVLELRGGGSAPAGPGLPMQRATICGELSPLARVAVESCGNGAGTLHNDAMADFFHVRAKVTALQRAGERLEGALQVGVGIAEVTSTADALGLKFGAAQELQPVEAAGTEASLSAKGRWWFSEKAHAVVDLNAGVAHIPGAPAVVGTPTSTVPFATLTAGLGF